MPYAELLERPGRRHSAIGYLSSVAYETEAVKPTASISAYARSEPLAKPRLESGSGQFFRSGNRTGTRIAL
jgi:hypothetical protein